MSCIELLNSKQGEMAVRSAFLLCLTYILKQGVNVQIESCSTFSDLTDPRGD